MKVLNHVLSAESGDPAVERVKTEKMSGEITPKIIVMHYTAGWTTAGDLYTLSAPVAKSRQASSHLLIGRNAEIYQIVPFNRRAWHAGPSYHKASGLSGLNAHSIGIEISNHGWVHESWTEQNGTVYTDQYGGRYDVNGVAVSGSRRVKPNGGSFQAWEKHYHPRLGNKYTADNTLWEPFTDDQLSVLDVIVRALVNKYPTIKYVVSHEEIDTRGWKTDPGPMFPLRRYQKIVENRGADDEEHIPESEYVTPPLSVGTLLIPEFDIDIFKHPNMSAAPISTAVRGSGMVVFEDLKSGDFVRCAIVVDGSVEYGWSHIVNTIKPGKTS